MNQKIMPMALTFYLNLKIQVQEGLAQLGEWS
jgi:hypothetical protein